MKCKTNFSIAFDFSEVKIIREACLVNMDAVVCIDDIVPNRLLIVHNFF